jgi:methionyl aminopeptidase
MNFPKSVCVSVNECIVHGIPSVRPLDEGDKINIDVTIYNDGYHGDNNLTVFYGQPKHEDIARVAYLAQQALYKAISICKPGIVFYELRNSI